MKIRSNYVSNSSSSSYIISCKGQKLAEYVKEAYGKVFDLFMELNPNYIGYGLNRENYQICSVDEIIKHFKEQFMSKEELKYSKEELEKEEKQGYVFLLGNSSSEDGTPEQQIMDMFNEYIINCLKGKYDWNNDCYKNDITIIFERRWS